MAWTAPATYSVSEVVTAAKLNTHIRDNLNYLKGNAGTVAIASGMTVAGTLVATAGGSSTDVLSALSGNAANYAGFSLGRAAGEARAAVPSSAGQFLAGAVAGDLTFRVDDSAKKVLIGCGGTETMVVTSAAVGIGPTAPQGKLHGYDVIGGFMHWKFDGVDGTARTVIPDGAGDVLYRANAMYVARASDGSTGGGSVAGASMVPGAGGISLLTVGADTLSIRVNANGSVEVLRSAGTTLTFKLSLWMVWL